MSTQKTRQSLKEGGRVGKGAENNHKAPSSCYSILMLIFLKWFIWIENINNMT